MLLPYRKYKATIDWIDQKKFSMESRATVFNLFLVDEWEAVDNDYEGFNDKFERTKITFKSLRYFIIRCKFDDFDAIMEQALSEAKMLDERSTFGLKKKALPTKTTYNGMLDYLFTPFSNAFIAHAYPKNRKPQNIDEAEDRVIWHHVQHYN